jgi:hypothetical protein
VLDAVEAATRATPEEEEDAKTKESKHDSGGDDTADNRANCGFVLSRWDPRDDSSISKPFPSNKKMVYPEDGCVEPVG